MSLLDTLIPQLQPWAHALYDLGVQAGVRPTITSALRTYAQQESAYKAFVEGRSRYPAAPPGTSAHEYGYAFDMVVASSVDQNDLGTVWKSWNGVWGGDFGQKDPIHFEFPGFVSPTGGTSQAAPQGSPSSADMRRKAEQLADQLIWFLPLPLRGILSTATIASAILSIFGSDAAAVIAWGLTHPAELADDLGDVLWGIARQSLGL